MTDQQSRAPRLNEQVAGLLSAVGRVAAAEQRRDLVERLSTAAERWRRSGTTLVVAGETKRGKSSLLNALLGTDRLPVAADVATNTYVVVRQGSPPRASVLFDGGRAPIAVDPADLATWASAMGNPANERGVAAVELMLDHPLLAAGVSLVDTPGVGGLDSAHARVTLAALASADALLFVVDANAPLTSHELRFLADAATRIDAVFVVLTKTDLFRGWRTIVDEDRALLRDVDPRLADAPLLAVSSRLEQLAAGLATTDPDESAALSTEAGFHALRRLLDVSVAGRASLLRLGNLLRVALTAVAELEAGVAASSVAAGGGSAAVAALEETNGTMEALKEAAARWQVYLTDQCNALREQVQVELTKALRRTGDRYEADLVAWARDPAALAEAVEADLRAVDLEVQALIDGEFEKLIGSLERMTGFGELGMGAAPGQDGDPVLAWASAPVPGTTDPTARMRIASSVVSGATGLVMFARTLLIGGGMMTGLVGAGVLFGAASLVMNLRNVRKQRDLTALRTSLRATLEAARAELPSRHRQRVVALQRQLNDLVTREYRDRLRELQRSVAQSTELARSDAATRQQAGADAARRLAELDDLKRRAAALLEEVARRRSTEVPAPPARARPTPRPPAPRPRPPSPPPAGPVSPY